MFIRLSEGTSTISIVSKKSGNTMVIYSSLSTNSPNVGSQKKGGGFLRFFFNFYETLLFLTFTHDHIDEQDSTVLKNHARNTNGIIG